MKLGTPEQFSPVRLFIVLLVIIFVTEAADTAMYYAKQTGNAFRFYEQPVAVRGA